MRKALGIANGLDRRVTLRAHPQNVSDEITANKFSFKHQWSSKENLFAICLLFIERLEIHKALDALGRAVGNGDEDSSHLDMFSLEMFENIAYIMAKHADSSIPDSPEEWMDEFSTFSIDQMLPKIIELWGLNVQTDVESKKTLRNRSADDHTLVSASLRTARHLHPESESSYAWAGE